MEGVYKREDRREEEFLASTYTECVFTMFNLQGRRGKHLSLSHLDTVEKMKVLPDQKTL